MNTSAKYQANWTETVGGVVRTRFCRQTDRQADSSIPPPPLRLRGYNKDIDNSICDWKGRKKVGKEDILVAKFIYFPHFY